MSRNALVVTLPWPDKNLWPNRKHGRNFRFCQNEKEAAKETAFVTTRNCPQTLAFQRALALCNPLPITYTFCPPNHIRRDLDGALSACKPLQDGIAMALNVDDSQFHPISLDWGDVDEGGEGRVVVTIGEP